MVVVNKSRAALKGRVKKVGRTSEPRTLLYDINSRNVIGQGPTP
jgi:hypothetical protein